MIEKKKKKRAFSVPMESMKKLLIHMPVMKELDVALEKGKHYLKTYFSHQCTNNTETTTHCIWNALYNLTNPDYQGKTCQKHLKTFVNIKDTINPLQPFIFTNIIYCSRVPLKQVSSVIFLKITHLQLHVEFPFIQIINSII